MTLHLLHPVTVHFTVAFLVAGGIAEGIGILIGRERLERFGGVLVLLGTASVVGTVVTGILAENSINHPPGSTVAIGRHESAGLLVLGVFVVALFWKAWDRGRVRESARPLYAIWLLAAVVLVIVTAWLGGDLVYTHGVGVHP